MTNGAESLSLSDFVREPIRWAMLNEGIVSANKGHGASESRRKFDGYSERSVIAGKGEKVKMQIDCYMRLIKYSHDDSFTTVNCTVVGQANKTKQMGGG
jgi:hypothetical protein